MSGTLIWSNVYFTFIISCWFSVWVFCQLLKVGYWNTLLLMYCSLCLLSCCCLVTRSCPILGDSVGCSTPGLPVLHYLLEFAQTHVHWVGAALQLSHLLSPPLLLPLVFPTIKVFSNESALCIRWSKYWHFSISPSNECSELISFRID